MKALIVVDEQNDFCKGGALEVPNGDEVVPVTNRLMATTHLFDLVVATQDYHPAGHKSFASRHEGKKPGDVIDLNGLQQVLWPDHCQWGTSGAEFHEKLLTGKFAAIFRKGRDPEVDSYSGFFDNGKRHSTGMNGYLKELGVDTLYVVGLATDYCVKFTVLDALALGFKVNVVVDACRAVNLNEGDGDKALAEMKEAGAILVKSDDLLKANMEAYNKNG